jgi:hypothetical protein
MSCCIYLIVCESTLGRGEGYHEWPKRGWEYYSIKKKNSRIVVIFVIASIIIIGPSVGMQYVRGVHGSELKTAAATFPYSGSSSGAQIPRISNIGTELSENNLGAAASNSTTVDDETQLNYLDSDGDALTDYEETKYYGTDPFNQDTDGDGLGDGNEIKGWVWKIEESRTDNSCMTLVDQCVIHKTDPTRADTDGDGNDDYFEYSNFPSDPSNPDQDHDQLLDGLESGSSREVYHTSYINSDSDDDGFSDGSEVIVGTDPLNKNEYPVIREPPSPAKHEPIGEPQRVLTIKNQPKDIVLRGSDVDGESLAFFISKRPLHGFLSPLTYTGTTSAKVTYTPLTEYVGADEFTFWVYDGMSYSKAPVTVSIVVNG